MFLNYQRLWNRWRSLGDTIVRWYIGNRSRGQHSLRNCAVAVPEPEPCAYASALPITVLQELLTPTEISTFTESYDGSCPGSIESPFATAHPIFIPLDESIGWSWR